MAVARRSHVLPQTPCVCGHTHSVHSRGPCGLASGCDCAEFREAPVRAGDGFAVTGKPIVKTEADMAAEEHEAQLRQAVTIRCAGCDWSLVGPQREARLAWAEHRRDVHGDVRIVGLVKRQLEKGPPSRRAFTRPKVGNVAQDVVENVRKTRLVGGASGPTGNGSGRVVVTRDELVEHALRWHGEHGALPSSLQWQGGRNGYPKYRTVVRVFPLGWREFRAACEEALAARAPKVCPAEGGDLPQAAVKGDERGRTDKDGYAVGGTESGAEPVSAGSPNGGEERSGPPESAPDLAFATTELEVPAFESRRCEGAAPRDGMVRAVAGSATRQPPSLPQPPESAPDLVLEAVAACRELAAAVAKALDVERRLLDALSVVATPEEA